jgi:hypothetical protein
MHSVPIAATKVVSSNPIHGGSRRDRERMVPGITTIYDTIVDVLFLLRHLVFPNVFPCLFKVA